MLSASAADAPRTDPRAAAEVLTRALRDEVRRTGFERGVIGLSGGLDSAAALMLAARALGPASVVAAALPVAGSPAEAFAHAEETARAAGVELRTLDLAPVLASLERALPGGGGDRVRRGNLAARARMIALYDLSAAERALVVGTSDKTEILLGYTTLWGDMAAALLPLGDLYKTEVRALARHLGVPAAVVDKPPSPDLWAGQTAEGELGFAYADADRVLYQWIDLGRRPADLIAAGYSADLVRAVERRVIGSSFKRRMPLVLKVSSRTVSMDFRLPRDAGT
ncbi:MAG TPA: NAD+ synthase [Planctomycetota bacterium]|nr:NAD+ synthase [Planctomycetota bacterium]